MELRLTDDLVGMMLLLLVVGEDGKPGIWAAFGVSSGEVAW